MTDTIAKYLKGPSCLIDGNIKPSVEKWWRHFYPNWDGKALDRMLDTHLTSSSLVLEIGAGSGEGHQRSFNIKQKVARHVGIDLDPRVESNPHLHEGLVSDANNLPFEDESFDCVFHTMVAEHLEKPAETLREICRVLKPGGVLLFETPSRFYYPMLIAAITPHGLHEWVVGRLGSGRAAIDVFPTYYRLNDKRRVHKLCATVGLESMIYYYASPPGYLRFHPLPFLLGVVYERSLARLIPPLRSGLLVKAVKKAA